MYKTASPQPLGGSSLRAAIGCLLDSESSWIKLKFSSALLHFFFFLFKKRFICSFLAVPGLCCCTLAFLFFQPMGTALVFSCFGVRVNRLLTAVTSLVEEHSL